MILSPGSDPLTAALEGSDPLSMFVAAAEAGEDDAAFQPVSVFFFCPEAHDGLEDEEISSM
jgi:hypothetical protein